MKFRITKNKCIILKINIVDTVLKVSVILFLFGFQVRKITKAYALDWAKRNLDVWKFMLPNFTLMLWQSKFVFTNLALYLWTNSSYTSNYYICLKFQEFAVPVMEDGRERTFQVGHIV